MIRRLLFALGLALASGAAHATCPAVPYIYPPQPTDPSQALTAALSGINSNFSLMGDCIATGGVTIILPAPVGPTFQFPPALTLWNTTDSDATNSNFLMSVASEGHGGAIAGSAVEKNPSGTGLNAFDIGVRGYGKLASTASGNKAHAGYFQADQYAAGTTTGTEIDCGNFLGNPAHYPVDRSFGTAENVCTGLLIASSVGNYPGAIGVDLEKGANGYYDGLIVGANFAQRHQFKVLSDSTSTAYPVLIQGKGNNSTSAIALPQAVLAADALTLDGFSVTAGVAGGFPATAQNVTITSAGNDSGVTFTVVGTAGGGGPQTNMVTGAAVGTATSANTFETVTSITASAAAAGAVSAGIASTAFPVPVIQFQVTGVAQPTYRSLQLLDTTGAEKWSVLQNGTVNINGKLVLSPTAPTISSGFGASPSVTAHNGPTAFDINVGTGGSASSGVIGLPTAATGWNCNATDITTATATVFLTKQTASSTTTATLTNFNTAGAAVAWVASDHLRVSCFPF